MKKFIKIIINFEFIYFLLLYYILFDLVNLFKNLNGLLQYFYDVIKILELNSSKLFYFILFYFICIFLDFIFNKIYYEVKDIYKYKILFFIAELILSIYILQLIFNIPKFPNRILFPYFLINFLILNFIKKKIDFKVKKTVFFLAIFIILWNLFLMTFNLKSDSNIFVTIFEENRLMIKTSFTQFKNNDINYYSLNCCSSDNYQESGFKPGNFMNLWNDYLIFTSGNGKFFITNVKNIGKTVFKLNVMQTNFYKFVDEESYTSPNMISVRGAVLEGDKIYVSYLREVKESCFNLAVVVSDVDKNILNFTNLFSFNECIYVDELNNSQLHSSGGAMVIDSNFLYLAVGEFLESTKAQDLTNYFGKILKINLSNSEVDIFSMGHRNIQGMTMQDRNILAVEHGPAGGDELNIIPIDSSIIQNYGWPISSYGLHYDGNFYEEMPLHKSHKDFGFIEPQIYFTPSIGISDIKIFNNNFLISSMKSGRLYELNSNSIGNVEQENYIFFGHRIREILIYDNQLLLFLEDLSGVAIINLS